MKLTYGSVCSGIEAASVAWEPLGLSPAWFAQFDPEHDYSKGPDFPSAVLAHHWPHVENLGDMTKIADMLRGGVVSAPDILVGGTPCQSWSVAGKGTGKNDPRGMLTFEFIKIIEAAKPKFVVWENVPGIVSNEGGKSFAEFMDAILSLGYTVNTDILDAQFFGVAQRRRRVFLVCQRADILMKKKNATSLNTGVIALLGILRSILAVHRAALGKKRVLLDVKCESVGAGLRRKISCFLAHGEEVYLPWLNSLADSLQNAAQEQECLASTPGLTTKMAGSSKVEEATSCLDLRQGMEKERQGLCSSTTLLWRRELEEIFSLVKSSTTSTELKTTTDQKIYTYAKMLPLIGRLIAQLNYCSHTSFKAMSSFLTLSKEFIDYARQTNKQISGGEWVYRFWDDFIREAERSSEVVASARKGFDPSSVLFEREGVRRDTAPSRETGSVVAALTANGVGTCGADDNQGQAGHLIPSKWPAEIASTLNASFGSKQGLEDQHIFQGASLFVPAISIHGTQDPDTNAELAHTPGRNHGQENAVFAFAENSRQEVRLEGGDGQITGALSCGGGKAGQGYPTAMVGMAVRRLTPIECERLQGFPDGYTAIPYRNKPAADGHRYKALGNSMAVPVIAWLGKRIIKDLTNGL